LCTFDTATVIFI